LVDGVGPRGQGGRFLRVLPGGRPWRGHHYRRGRCERGVHVHAATSAPRI